jgi:hypothetical protein
VTDEKHKALTINKLVDEILVEKQCFLAILTFPVLKKACLTGLGA